MEDVAGRDQVVEHEQPDRAAPHRAPADQARRRQPPPEPDEREERRPEHDRQARRAGEPEQQPADELAAIDARAPPRSRGPAGRRSDAALDGRLVGEVRSPGRRAARSRSPAALSPTATMWAWYQVVASWAVYQKTVPNAKKTVVAEPDGRPDPAARPSTHQQIATSTAARTVKIVWSSVARPHSATNGSRTTAGSGGNGSRPRGDAVASSRPAGRPGSTRCRAAPPLASTG